MGKYSIRTLIYIIKLLKYKQNMEKNEYLRYSSALFVSCSWLSLTLVLNISLVDTLVALFVKNNFINFIPTHVTQKLKAYILNSHQHNFIA